MYEISGLGLITSAPLWSNARVYPLTPIAPWFPILSAPWDTCLLALMLAALVAAGWIYRPAVISFLTLSFFSYCQDQNRGQPWLYMYWVMLLLTLWPPPTATAACRLAMTVVYFWSGVQKLNRRFFLEVPKWFIAPAEKWHLPPLVIKLMQAVVAATPFIEIAIALALWIPGTRRPAIITVAVLHLSALMFLSPFGHGHNSVVWPWNVAMIGLVWLLFSTGSLWTSSASVAPRPINVSPKKPTSVPTAKAASGSPINLARSLKALSHFKPALIIVTLYSLLPALSFAGKWDSFFSFALYSENQSTANVFITKELRDKLSPELQKHVKPFLQTYDTEYQGPYSFDFQKWCYETIHVPPLPEPRSFRVMFEFLHPYAKQPADLRMIIRTRGGPVVFFEGDRVEYLDPSN